MPQLLSIPIQSRSLKHQEKQIWCEYHTKVFYKSSIFFLFWLMFILLLASFLRQKMANLFLPTKKFLFDAIFSEMLERKNFFCQGSVTAATLLVTAAADCLEFKKLWKWRKQFRAWCNKTLRIWNYGEILRGKFLRNFLLVVNTGDTEKNYGTAIFSVIFSVKRRISFIVRGPRPSSIKHFEL